MELLELKKLCISNNIPIIRDNTLELIKQIIIKNNYHSILEIGSAYGYSALAFSNIPNITKVVSIEKLTSNYEIAQQSANDKIEFINADAFEYIPNQKFDLIFIDGPKSHQEVLFTKYKDYLNSDGTIVIDNMYLRKFSNRTNLTKNQKNLVDKVNKFRQWLVNLKDVSVEIKDLDDGVAIIKNK